MAITVPANATISNVGTSSEVTFTRPSGWTSGGVAIVSMQTTSNPTFTDNNGSTPFTQLSQRGPGDNSMKMAVFRRVLGSSEPASYSFTISAAAAWSVVGCVYDGVDNSTPEDVADSEGGNTGTVTTATAPSLTTVTNGAMNICIAAIDHSGDTYSAKPSGYTDRVDQATNCHTNLVDLIITTAGATGDQSWTYSTADENTTIQIALRPSTTVTLLADAGAFLITGSLLNDVLEALIGAYVIDGQDASTLYSGGGIILTAVAGAYTIAGVDASFDIASFGDVGAVLITGTDATLIFTSEGSQTEDIIFLLHHGHL